MITADKRKAVFLLHQEGMPIREISRQLKLSRNAVRRIIAQSGQMPQGIRPPTLILDPERLRQLHQECDGYAQRMAEKLREEHGIAVKYSTLTRHLRDLGICAPMNQRCERVPDEPGAEMQHDTSPFMLLVGSQRLRLQASLLYLRYSKRRYLQFYPVFDRFHMKCFLHLALMHWGYAPRICVIDNTNLARLRGLGANAVIVPEMEALAKGYGFRFLCHAPGHPDRKAGEERSFLTVETNFVPGRTFQSLEDLNRQALEWSTVRLEQRPQGKAGLIPAQAFEHERAFLTQLPRHLPAPYQLLERSVDEYGYVAVEGHYYEVPGNDRGKIQVLRYLNHLVLGQARQQRLHHAKIPEKWVMDTFAFDRQPKLNKKKILALYDSMAFLRDKQNIIWMGGTGLGKTGLARSFLIRAIEQGARGRYVLFADLLHELHRAQADRSQSRVIRRYLPYDLLLIDEIGSVEAEPAQVGLFFTLLQKRHKQRSTLITSNLGFSEWASFLKNPHLTAALIDRLTESSHLFNMKECVTLRGKMPDEP